MKRIFKGFSLATCLLGCVSSSVAKSELDNSPQILIRFTVERYEENAKRFYYTDGNYSTIHITTLRIDSPKEYIGKILNINHPGYSNPESIWISVGRSFEAVIDQAYLEDPEHSFRPQDFGVVVVGQ